MNKQQMIDAIENGAHLVIEVDAFDRHSYYLRYADGGATRLAKSVGMQAPLAQMACVDRCYRKQVWAAKGR